MFKSLDQNLEKNEVFTQIEVQLKNFDFEIIAQDQNRPWGGFFVIDPNQIAAFKEMFFKEVDIDLTNNLSFSPKILLVAPNQKLSWQYHYRRSELWKLVTGEAAIARSETDKENPSEPMIKDQVVKLAQGERHRLIGTDGWGVVAEIWVHTDANNPSNEEDIVRLQDDYARK
ncbi:phosphoheptose isomerase [Belliella sp. DSM 107340]|uniref:Phosphoheptose isomerase n=1 Tax=Belliella calami TaxID=2923436 RepID=A0ABS9UPZ5_9BACT|nr:phosphoheptose isomerase [Belliella calami]MCH7398333.1 phosphoheptose isomerase [Belliella calami]